MYDVQNYIQIVESLHARWVPHTGQIKVGTALFRDDMRSLFVQCGRKWGKTELAAYILWRWAQTFPGLGCYYITPLLNQGRELVWADPRLIHFGPREWLLDGSEGINNTEMRLKFKNGSFIKVDGSDNYEKHRGTRPGILIYEEFKDHKKQFREIMRPNLSVYNAPEVFIGTPPEDTGDEAIDEFLLTAEEHKNNAKKLFHHAPTWENPHISKEWLKEEQERLYGRGEGDVWEREYAANYVKGGAKKIFPMFDRSVIRNHDELMRELHRDLKKLEWYVWADPAGATCFAVLFAAMNPYTKTWYFLDEIYETKQEEMTVQRIGDRLLKIKQELNPRYEWRQGYDEAATWFANEMLDHFGESFEPSTKSKSDKLTGLSLIKDTLLQHKFVMSSRCEKLFWEMDRYCKDDSGKIPKRDDHLIDNLRYILSASHYDLIPKREHRPEMHENWRGSTPEMDFPNMNGEWELT
jgi:hypothetical protein